MSLNKVFNELDKLDGMMEKFTVIVDAIKKRPGLFTILGLVIVVAGVFVAFTAYKQYKHNKVAGVAKSKTSAKTVTLDPSKQKEDTIKDPAAAPGE
ncbi:hypothetical protein ES703_96051 [subsurface metagenome]|jgi:uncharacterized membrane protein YebE (DUF533 family)